MIVRRHFQKRNYYANKPFLTSSRIELWGQNWTRSKMLPKIEWTFPLLCPCKKILSWDLAKIRKELKKWKENKPIQRLRRRRWILAITRNRVLQEAKEDNSTIQWAHQAFKLEAKAARSQGQREDSSSSIPSSIGWMRRPSGDCSMIWQWTWVSSCRRSISSPMKSITWGRETSGTWNCSKRPYWAWRKWN